MYSAGAEVVAYGIHLCNRALLGLLTLAHDQYLMVREGGGLAAE